MATPSQVATDRALRVYCNHTETRSLAPKPPRRQAAAPRPEARYAAWVRARLEEARAEAAASVAARQAALAGKGRIRAQATLGRWQQLLALREQAWVELEDDLRARRLDPRPVPDGLRCRYCCMAVARPVFGRVVSYTDGTSAHGSCHREHPEAPAVLAAAYAGLDSKTRTRSVCRFCAGGRTPVATSRLVVLYGDGTGLTSGATGTTGRHRSCAASCTRGRQGRSVRDFSGRGVTANLPGARPRSSGGSAGWIVPSRQQRGRRSGRASCAPTPAPSSWRHRLPPET